VYLPLVFERSLAENPDLPDDIVRHISASDLGA
jgi:hypothetical protein